MLKSGAPSRAGWGGSEGGEGEADPVDGSMHTATAHARTAPAAAAPAPAAPAPAPAPAAGAGAAEAATAEPMQAGDEAGERFESGTASGDQQLQQEECEQQESEQQQQQQQQQGQEWALVVWLRRGGVGGHEGHEREGEAYHSMDRGALHVGFV